jgi:hypothetical protein
MPDHDHDNPFELPQSGDSSSPGREDQDPFDDASRRQLALVKHDHRYVFNYTPGEESELFERLIHMARDPNCPLEMFDAAVLSHQVGKRLSQQIEKSFKP